MTAGEEVRLPCGPPPGHPPPEVEWRKDGAVLQLEAAAGPGHDLVLAAAQQSDEGRYQCVARNMAGVRHSTQALLSVYGKAELASNFIFEGVKPDTAAKYYILFSVAPFVIKAPDNASVDAGTEAKFSCVVGGDPAPEVRWEREGGAVSYVAAAEVRPQCIGGEGGSNDMTAGGRGGAQDQERDQPGGGPLRLPRGEHRRQGRRVRGAQHPGAGRGITPSNI